jgi:hypothetical protein
MSEKAPGGSVGADDYPGSITRNTDYNSKFSYASLLKSFLGVSPLTLFDIGARYGESTNWFANHLNIKIAHLFEPNPFLTTIVDKKIEKFSIHKIALSNVSGIQNFYIHELEGMSSLEKINVSSADSISYANKALIKNIEVQTSTLDSLDIEAPDLVKIDVQSHEHKLLEGGVHMLKKAKIIVIEVGLYDMYSTCTKIGEIERLLPSHSLFSIPFISYNPKNFRTDWVELFFVQNGLNQHQVY